MQQQSGFEEIKLLSPMLKKVGKTDIQDCQQKMHDWNPDAATKKYNDNQKKQQLCLESVCDISQNFLIGKSVKPIHRMQLKLWFMTEMRNIDMSRQTYTTASRYLDVYFSRGKDVRLKSFQNLGVSCFMLAGKIVERRCPQFTFQNYGLQEIMKFEQQISNISGFDIFPTTYFHLAEGIMERWDQFLSDQQMMGCFYLHQQNQSIKRYRSIMDILDFIDLTPTVYTCQLQQIVLCLFYLKNYNFMFPDNGYPNHLQLEYFFQDTQEPYNLLFDEFMQSLRKDQYFMNIEVELKTLSFVLGFLKHIDHYILYTGRKPIHPNGYTSMNKAEFRYHMTVQNFNPNHEKLAKDFLNKNLQ